MRRTRGPELLSTREALSQLTVPVLKPLAALIGAAPTRKGELVACLERALTDPATVRRLYATLDKFGQIAVQEAVHDPQGVLHRDRFRAKYGGPPDFGGLGRRKWEEKPTALQLFFPGMTVLPTDLRPLLREFVPAPPPLTVATLDELPARVKPPHVDRGLSYRTRSEGEVDLRVRSTARAALHNVTAVLRLVDAGGVKVAGLTRRPTPPSLSAVAAVLADGDFYGPEDRYPDFAEDPGSDLNIQAFAWPLLVQAAGLAEVAGSRLRLSASGRKAAAGPAHQAIRLIWGKWQKTTLVDEFHRVQAVKGQQSRGRNLTAVADRRRAVVRGLRECPPGKWVPVEELFRVLQVLVPEFQLTHDPWKLYLSERRYGSFGNGSRYSWEMLQGRFALAFLFEYAATLGLVDVAYISPVGARNDYCDHWGSDGLSCLSRYDGLMYFRVNALGAWCLGLAGDYQPETVAAERAWKVLPNLDVVAAGHAPSRADVLFLERFAERTSEAVWRLSKDKVLTAVEQGLEVGELREFLESRGEGLLPQTVAVMFDDLRDRAAQLRDEGMARLVVCRDEVVARTLAADRRLRGLCQLAGERSLVFRAADESAVRRALRDLGYVLPPPR